jgi:hypothetical protein
MYIRSGLLGLLLMMALVVCFMRRVGVRGASDLNNVSGD